MKYMTLLFIVATTALAHDRYLLPSHTVLSGEKESISLVASISNDMFHHDRPLGDDGQGNVPSRLKGLFASLQGEVIYPNGNVDKQHPWRAYARFSASDMNLTEHGTYRIGLNQKPSLMLTFKKKDGQGGRAFGKKAVAPEGATNVKRYMTSSRVETYVTLDAPSQAAWKPQGEGVELTGESHPNDLFVGEPAQFRLTRDGQALTKATKVTLVREDTRHRNQRKEIEVETDDTGAFTVTFPEAGFYLLKASTSEPGKAGSGIDAHYYSLYVTLEVFPE